MNTPVQNFAFEEHLVRVVDYQDEKWFVAADVCRVLDIKNPRDAVGRLDEDEKGVASTDTLGGNQEVLIVSESGLFTIILRSRAAMTPGTMPHRFRKWVTAEVLPQIHKTGAYAQDEQAMPSYARPTLDKDAPLASRIDAVRVARSIFGKDSARALWLHLGLPAIEPDEFSNSGEAVYLLRRILDMKPEAGDGRTMRSLILDALEGDDNAMTVCVSNGVKPVDNPEGYYVGQSHPSIRQLYAVSPWKDGAWRMAVRRLSGITQRAERMTFYGHQSRVMFMPLNTLDDYCGTRH